MKAMIMAAGRGERLKPLTDTTPKALIELNGKPLIVHHIENLRLNGFREIVINLAYLGDKIKSNLGSGQAFGVDITYSHEIEGGLETGGGITQALPLLGDSQFLVINADIFCQFPLSKLTQPIAKLAHLILVNNPPHNPNGDYGLIGSFLCNNKNQPGFTFSGIAVYQPTLFEGLKSEKFSVTPIVRKMADEKLVTAEVYDGLWHDIGTEERLKAAKNALKKHTQNT